MSKKIYNFDEVISRRNSDCKKFNPTIYPPEILPMWIADTDFPVPDEAYEAAKNRVEHNLYGYPYDMPEFNEAVVGWYKRRHNYEFTTDCVDYAFGVVPAAIHCIMSMTHPGDKIVCLTPLYSPLREAVVDNGRTLLSSTMDYEDGIYSINWADLEAKLADNRTEMFILCNPHNPGGKVYTKEELLKIGELCLKYEVIVFNDEIHADIVYSGVEYTSFPTLSKEFANITITGINPGKTFNVAGVRTGAVIIENKDLMDKYIRARKNCKAMGRTVMGQNVFIACYEHGDDYADQLVVYLEANRDYIVEYIEKNIPELKAYKQDSSYLLWINCKELGLPQKDLMKLFEQKGKIAMNNGASFGVEGTGFVRLNFAVPRSVLEEGCKRLKDAVDYWRNNK